MLVQWTVALLLQADHALASQHLDTVIHRASHGDNALARGLAASIVNRPDCLKYLHERRRFFRGSNIPPRHGRGVSMFQRCALLLWNSLMLQDIGSYTSQTHMGSFLGQSPAFRICSRVKRRLQCRTRGGPRALRTQAIDSCHRPHGSLQCQGGCSRAGSPPSKQRQPLSKIRA